MVDAAPFMGLRPSQEHAAYVASVPYDVVSSEEARILVRNNPMSLLNVTKPEVGLDPSVSEYDEQVYTQGKRYFHTMLEKGWLKKDVAPCYYLYRITMGAHTQTGFVLAASTQDYLQGHIRKHEFTRQDKEADRIKHLNAVQAHTGKVFLIHPTHDGLDSFASSYTHTHAPDIDFKAEDGIRHTLWVVQTSEDIDFITTCFKKIPTLYIADGHHRAAAAAAVSTEKHSSSWQKFLAVSFPENQCRIWDYNRVVKDLNGLSEEAFLKKIKEHFDIEKTFKKPNIHHTLSMYLGNEWYFLTLKKHCSHRSPVESLDVHILQSTLLDPILGISNPRQDKRIDFVGGIRGYQELEKRVHEGWAVAFWMYPTSIQQLLEVANTHDVMPPKSTWFEPKLRDGVVVYQP